MTRTLHIVAAMTASLLIATVAQAQPGLAEVGPIDPVKGFPQWIQDWNGVALQIGLDGDGSTGLSLFDPVDPEFPFSAVVGFGAEAFYMSAESSITLPGNRDARLVLAVEAAYAADEPIDGDQTVFARVRIRIDTPVPGDYTVIHPYGVNFFPNRAAGDRGINYTSDIGGITPDFSRVLGGAIGPYLRAVNPPPPAGYIGNPQVDQTVTGSPFGTNFFRIEGPPGADLDGAGNNFVQTELFQLCGKHFDGQTPTPMRLDRATYSRNTLGKFIDVYATAVPTATLIVNAGPTIVDVPMITDGTGNYFARLPVGAETPLPATVAVTGTNPPSSLPTTLTTNLVDAVHVTRALYDATNHVLTIDATSSDTLPRPTLTVVGYGTMSPSWRLVVPDVAVPPGSVTVTSSAGGSGTRQMDATGASTLPPLPLSADAKAGGAAVSPSSVYPVEPVSP